MGGSPDYLSNVSRAAPKRKGDLVKRLSRVVKGVFSGDFELGEVKDRACCGAGYAVRLARALLRAVARHSGVYHLQYHVKGLRAL
tara:strand:- start:868 stop:1122 length:255 start_codon:yes stop_codon:yes gene_type:complete